MSKEQLVDMLGSPSGPLLHNFFANAETMAGVAASTSTKGAGGVSTGAIGGSAPTPRPGAAGRGGGRDDESRDAARRETRTAR